MGWQNLSYSLRLWDTSSKAVSEVEAAAEEVLAGGDDAEALEIFSEALDPSLQRGTDFLKRLAETDGAKCRCDAVWYGDTIAYGCKTCGLSSASCICVFCFDAGDHEGHDFYISRSDYGCCDCGDAYAWRPSGFCRHHPGPRPEIDPAQLLPEATRRRAQLLISTQVRRLVKFHPSVLPGVAPPPPVDALTSRRRVKENTAGDPVGTSAPSSHQGDHGPDGPTRVLITGINLRVTEEQLKDFLDGKLATGPRTGSIVSFELQRDQESHSSKGRAYVTMTDTAGAQALGALDGEVLRGSPLRIHLAPHMATAEKHLKALEANFEWLLSLGGFHDGLRKIIGQVFLDRNLLGQAQSAVEILLRHSHLMEPSVRKLETNLMVDLMLDLDFKHRFAKVFTTLYHELVQNREGNQDTNELGDFTCQIFTRQDVTLELVREMNLLKTLLNCLWDLLSPTLLEDAQPPVFNHESKTFRDHEIIQCSMDLLYVLDHAEVAKEILRSERGLREELWQGWLRILVAMQAMNPHVRRTGSHVEFTNPSWGNALTLHTDLMSNTWLILDAVETKAELEPVMRMVRLAWQELRGWMLQVHLAEGRVGAAAMESIDYEVAAGTSFHVPVNRVLGMLIHQLCTRASASGKVTSVEQVFHGVGMAESDILWWMEHPLRALVLQAQVMVGMWRRNGEALEHESEFYRMNYWHHLLIDADLLVLRLSTLMVRPESFFRITMKRFELHRWLEKGDPLARLLSAKARDAEQESDPFAMQKLQSYVLFLYHMLSGHTPLSLTWQQLVTHTTRQFLGVGAKSHSQLWDPRLERSTATAMVNDQQTLEAALKEISDFSAADGTGHGSAKYHLNSSQWFAVDPYFHLLSWSEQQKVEENLASALKANGQDLADWVEESARRVPPVRGVYREPWIRWCSSGTVQAFCWLLLVRLAFQPQKDLADGRLLVLSLLLALRSSYASPGPEAEGTDAQMEMELPTEEMQLFWLAQAMGRGLASSAQRRFAVKVESSTGEEVVLEVSLLDALDRLAATDASLSSSLARGLRKRLTSHRSSLSSSQAGEVTETCPMEVDEGDPEEARKAKRRKAAFERQQRMLDTLRKRQAAFISEAGQKYDEPTGSPDATETSPNTDESTQAGECVVCMSHQDLDPLGLICFLRPAVASSMPRERVPTESAVLLQSAPRAPLGAFKSRPQCFEPHAPDGLVLARACSHRMHFSCWSRFRPALNTSGRMSCPYCGTLANALLPVRKVRDVGTGVDLESPPQGHVEASEDFLMSLEGQMARLGLCASSQGSDDFIQALGGAAGPAGALGAAPRASHPFVSLSKLLADNIAMAEVRTRSRSELSLEKVAASSSSSNPQKRPLESSVTSAANAWVFQAIVDEALEAAPPFLNVNALAFEQESSGKLAVCLLEATPHRRLEILTALLLGLWKQNCQQLGEAGRRLVHGFYLFEALVVLASLADDSLVETQLAREALPGAPSLWHWVQSLAGARSASAADTRGTNGPVRITPLHSLEEAVEVVRLALNPFLYKVRFLLFLLAPEEFSSWKSLFGHAWEVLPPAEDHARLSCADYGLPDVEDLLMLHPQGVTDTTALTQLLGSLPTTSSGLVLRGKRPRSPILLVLVGDPVIEAPPHVWQMPQSSFERLHASGCQELVELSLGATHSQSSSARGAALPRLFCVAYRLSLPIITGHVYQKFYTQFVHARCTVCKTSSSIPTLCLLCGTFLCCNSECCRRPLGENGQMVGEVTQHAQVCGFGTCVFLQLSNSLVHIVADGFITCWGSLYLDGHGEEEYNLSRPLHISEVRLHQLTQLIREVSFDFESRLKWKKVILV